MDVEDKKQIEAVLDPPPVATPKPSKIKSKLLLALSDGDGKIGMLFQWGCILALRDMGLLQRVAGISASGNGCLLLAMILDELDPSLGWPLFVSPANLVSGASKAVESKTSDAMAHHIAVTDTQVDTDDEDHPHEKKSLLGQQRLSNEKREFPLSIPMNCEWSSKITLKLIRMAAEMQDVTMGRVHLWHTLLSCGCISMICPAMAITDFDLYMRALRSSLCQPHSDAPLVGSSSIQVAAHETQTHEWVQRNVETTATNSNPLIAMEGTLARTQLLGGDLIAYVNGPFGGGHLQGRIQLIPFPTEHTTMLHLAGALSMPSKWGTTYVHAPKASHKKDLVYHSSATELDPLGLRSAELFKLQLKLDADCLLLLDVFTGSSKATEQPDSVKQAVGEDIGRLCSRPVDTKTQETLHAFNQQVCQFSRLHDEALTGKQCKDHLAVCRRAGSHFGASMSASLAEWLINTGYRLTVKRFS